VRAVAADVDVEAAELDALLAAYALKDERRTGWQLRGVSRPETVAGHTWGVCLLVLAFADRAGVDPDRALRLAVVHDLAEADVGDVPTRADPDVETMPAAEKQAREREAIESYDDAFAGVALRDLWEAYERRESETAAFVKDMDLVDMVLQALYYERGGRYEPGDSAAFAAYDRLDEFFATAEPRLRTDVGRALFDAIEARYEAAKATRDDATATPRDDDADATADPRDGTDAAPDRREDDRDGADGAEPHS
jgi:putative hydrolase of HD superfamily